jgi:hypothetical protein
VHVHAAVFRFVAREALGRHRRELTIARPLVAVRARRDEVSAREREARQPMDLDRVGVGPVDRAVAANTVGAHPTLVVVLVAAPAFAADLPPRRVASRASDGAVPPAEREPEPRVVEPATGAVAASATEIDGNQYRRHEAQEQPEHQ